MRLTKRCMGVDSSNKVKHNGRRQTAEGETGDHSVL